jgi:hypothetical protein
VAVRRLLAVARKDLSMSHVIYCVCVCLLSWAVSTIIVRHFYGPVTVPCRKTYQQTAVNCKTNGMASINVDSNINHTSQKWRSVCAAAVHDFHSLPWLVVRQTETLLLLGSLYSVLSNASTPPIIQVVNRRDTIYSVLL